MVQQHREATLCYKDDFDTEKYFSKVTFYILSHQNLIYCSSLSAELVKLDEVEFATFRYKRLRVLELSV